MHIKQEKYDRLVDTAIDLFSRHGFAAVGVNRIIRKSGIASMTFYKYFGSKEQLAVVALGRHSAHWREWFFGAVADLADVPLERILVCFNVLDHWFRSQDFRGCLFQRALAEFPAKDHPVHQAALEHRQALRRDLLEAIRRLVRRRDARAEHLAASLEVLIQGAIALGTADAARSAKRVAKLLLENASGGTTREHEASPGSRH